MGFFFARKVDFGAKMKREETQERAIDVGPVKGKERERQRERKRGKEGLKDRSFCTHVRTLS